MNIKSKLEKLKKDNDLNGDEKKVINFLLWFMCIERIDELNKEVVLECKMTREEIKKFLAEKININIKSVEPIYIEAGTDMNKYLITIE